MQVDVSFDEFGLLLQAVNNLKMQAQSVSEIAAFEHLLAKLFQASHTVPVPPDTRDETTFIQHQPWHTGNYRFVEPTDWAAAVAAQRRSESKGEAMNGSDSPAKPETQA
jgi:hypothetical protein